MGVWERLARECREEWRSNCSSFMWAQALWTKTAIDRSMQSWRPATICNSERRVRQTRRNEYVPDRKWSQVRRRPTRSPECWTHRYLWPVDPLNCFLFCLSQSQFFLYAAWGPASSWLDSSFEVPSSLRAIKKAKNGKFRCILTIADGGKWPGGDSGVAAMETLSYPSLHLAPGIKLHSALGLEL